MDVSILKDKFSILGNAINSFEEVLSHPEINTNKFIRDSAIKRFEFTFELFWKTIKKILYVIEKEETTGPRDALSKSYQYKAIDDEKLWLSMLDDRNEASHIYNEEIAKHLLENIKSYLPIYQTTYQNLKNKYNL